MEDWSFVHPSILTPSRLDSSYYATRFLRNEQALATCGLPRKKVSVISLLCNCGATPKNVAYGSKGMGLIRTTDVRPNEFLLDGVLRTEDLDTSAINESITARPLDIVYTMSGTVGYASVIPNVEEVFSFSNTIARIRLPANSSNDPHYLSSFFGSKYGYEQSMRLVSGGIQGHVMPNPFKQLLVVLPDPPAQKYVGQKIKDSEKLQEYVRRELTRADAKFSLAFKHKQIPSMRAYPRRVVREHVSTLSLNPEFSRSVEGQKSFQDSKKLGSMVEYCKCGDPIKESDRRSGQYAYYGASGEIDKHDEYNVEGVHLIVAQDGSIGCVNVVRDRVWANNHVWVLRVKDEYDVDSIARYLEVFFPYWSGVTTGSVIPKVTAQNLLSIMVPLNIAKDFDSGDCIRRAVSAAWYAKKLRIASHYLVDGLIEGKFTESKANAAKVALDLADSFLDKSILSRLKTGGIDGDGAPLFPDLDQLYELLERVYQELEA